MSHDVDGEMLDVLDRPSVDLDDQGEVLEAPYGLCCWVIGPDECSRAIVWNLTGDVSWSPTGRAY